jgi:hypothetical protein
MHLTAFGAVQVSNLFIKVVFPPINFQPQFANSLYIFQIKEQVSPTGVCCADKGCFGIARTPLELFFSQNGFCRRSKLFVIDQFMHVVFLGKAREFAFLVFEDAVLEVGSNPNIQDGVSDVRKDIDKGGFGHNAGLRLLHPTWLCLWGSQ